MRLRSGKVKEEDSNLDNYVNITQSLFDDTENILEESPISSCGKCVTCNRGFLNTDPVYYNKVTGEKFVVTQKKVLVYYISLPVPNRTALFNIQDKLLTLQIQGVFNTDRVWIQEMNKSL